MATKKGSRSSGLNLPEKVNIDMRRLTFPGKQPFREVKFIPKFWVVKLHSLTIFGGHPRKNKQPRAQERRQSKKQIALTLNSVWGKTVTHSSNKGEKTKNLSFLT